MSHNCHAVAECTDTFGAFNCTCQPGYSGNGTFCENGMWCKFLMGAKFIPLLVIHLNPLSTGQSKMGRRRPIKSRLPCVLVSQRISTNKISLERSFHYLNVDTLFLNIGQEMTPLQPFEVTQLIDLALDWSTSMTRGRDFAHCIAMVTRNVLDCIQQMTARIQAVD